MQETEYIWHNGEMKPWQDVTVHVLAHVIHYGSSVFEGIRVYETPTGNQVFRLEDHLQRLYFSAKVYRINVPYSLEVVRDACKKVVIKNGLESAYLRPVVYRGYGGLGVCAGPDDPVETAVAAINWGAYLGADAIEGGVDVCVSSWNRVAPNTIPAMAKAAGNYLSSQLISMEAKRLGFAEGIGLSPSGMISEGAGENIFLVKKGIIYTPTSADSVLSGITRDTAMTLARDLGYEVVEQTLPREMLYLADEVFFTGTAAEVTPVRSVDRIEVGNGGRGPITEAVQQAFFGLFDGRTEDKWGWLEPVKD